MKMKLVLLAFRFKDREYISWAKAQLGNAFNPRIVSIIQAATCSSDDEECKVHYSVLVQSDLIEAEVAANIMLEIEEVRKKKEPGIAEIMELYHSGNDFLVKKAKEFVVEKYGNYVLNILRKEYPTYAEKYREEMYHSGVMGLITAMKNYNVSKGAFTTYSKLFIKHEINEQINFLNNDTTVHYNAVQRKITEAISAISDEGYEPTVERISIMAEMKPEVVRRELDYIERTKFIYLDDESEDLGDITDYSTSPEKLVIENERYACLQKCIDSLPEVVRKVVWQKYLTSDNNEKIANDLNLSIGQVRNNFQKGLESLRNDRRLCETFYEYLSDADRELMEYLIPVVEDPWIYVKQIGFEIWTDTDQWSA